MAVFQTTKFQNCVHVVLLTEVQLKHEENVTNSFKQSRC